jgi:hypothetical protein
MARPQFRPIICHEVLPVLSIKRDKMIGLLILACSTPLSSNRAQEQVDLWIVLL